MTMPIVMLQTAAGEFYSAMLDVTSVVMRTYCALRNIEYRSYLGIKYGYYDWQSTYNRIAMLDELVCEDFKGWVLFADADAFVRNLEFSAQKYLSELPSNIALIAAPGANSGVWDINAGVFFINLGSDNGRKIVAEWKRLLGLHVPDRHLRAVSQPWGRLPSGDTILNDQTLLHLVLQDSLPLQQSLHIETDLLNYTHGRFIAQLIRQPGLSNNERLDQLRRACAKAIGRQENWRNLDYIANEANTDKGSKVGNAHVYTRYYSFLLEQFRYRRFNALEIGLLRGGPEAGGVAGRDTAAVPSVKMWLEYFPFVTLFGIDISDFYKFQSERFMFHQLDLSDLDAAQSVRDRLPTMSFVVDDASHASYHQQVAFATFFPLVAPGGYYVIEDCDWQPGHMESELPRVERTRDIFQEFMNFGLLDLHETIRTKCDASALINDISDVFIHRKEGEHMGPGIVKFICIRKRNHA